jgi:hypothetical protein
MQMQAATSRGFHYLAPQEAQWRPYSWPGSTQHWRILASPGCGSISIRSASASTASARSLPRRGPGRGRRFVKTPTTYAAPGNCTTASMRSLKDCVVAFGEIPSGAQHARSAFGFGVAVGVLASCKIPLFEVMPLETKLGSVGIKTADKPDIIRWAAELYPEAPWQRYEAPTRGKKPHAKGDLHDDNEHVADAIAIVHAGICLPEFKQSLAFFKIGAEAGKA